MNRITIRNILIYTLGQLLPGTTLNSVQIKAICKLKVDCKKYTCSFKYKCIILLRRLSFNANSNRDISKTASYLQRQNFGEIVKHRQTINLFISNPNTSGLLFSLYFLHFYKYYQYFSEILRFYQFQTYFGE